MNDLNDRWLVLVNPVAGAATGRITSRFLEGIRQSFPDSEVVFSTYPGETVSILRRAVGEGFHRFCIAGGDGSVHEAMNGIFSEGIPEKRPTLAVFPIGSGNDWARSQGFTRSVKALLGRMRSQEADLADIGRVEYSSEEGDRHRYFCNVAGLAYDAAVARKLRNKKFRFPRWVYLYEALRGLFTYRGQNAAIQVDGARYDGACFTINAGVQPFSGGGMQLVPHARGLSGKLAVTVLEPKPGLVLLPQMLRLFNGSIHRLSYAHAFTGVEMSVTHLDEAIPLEADGEFLGWTPARFSVIPDAVYVPVV